MNLKESLDFIDVGNQHILLSDKDSNEYYYNYMYLFKEDTETYNKLLPLEVINIDADGYNNTITFYLW